MYTKLKCSCLICKAEITTNNINKHYKSKSCLNPSVKIVDGKCPYCEMDLNSLPKTSKPGHIRWCSKNPKIDSYKSPSGETILKRVANTNYKAIAEKLSQRHKEGVYKDAPLKSIATKAINGTNKHTEASKEKCRISALKSNHQRVCKSTHEYIDKQGRVFKFDSSWEDTLADRLDYLDIAWDRPPPIHYQLNDQTKKYFPDFYLPKYDLYLDPKNSYCEEQQKEKLNIVSDIINLKILRSKEECASFII